MSLSGPAGCWVSTPSAARLLFREFEDGTVCFDPDTGETLQLSHLARFLLELWATDLPRPLTRDELLSEVLAVDDSATDVGTAARLIDQALNELQQAGFAASGQHA